VAGAPVSGPWVASAVLFAERGFIRSGIESNRQGQDRRRTSRRGRCHAEDGTGTRLSHILFIDSAHDGESRRIIEGLGDASVLTVGEKKGFLEKGGTINFVLQGDFVKFEVNHRAAIRIGLQISSRLLMLAQRTVE
jgi:hypothetical protein